MRRKKGHIEGSIKAKGVNELHALSAYNMVVTRVELEVNA